MAQLSVLLLVVSLAVAQGAGPALPTVKDPGSLQYLLKDRQGLFHARPPTAAHQQFNQRHSSSHHAHEQYSRDHETYDEPHTNSHQTYDEHHETSQQQLYKPHASNQINTHGFHTNSHSSFDKPHRPSHPSSSGSRGPSGSPPPPRTIVPSFAPRPAVTAPPATPAGPNRDGYVNYATSEPYSEPHAESSYPAAQTYGGSGGGLFSGLGNLGKYGGVMAPVLLATGLLFLFPSVKNITSTSSRRRRELAAPEDESTDRTRDLVERLQVIYASLDEDDLCASWLFCQLGEVIADSPDPARIIRYMDFFYPSKDPNMKIMEKAAYAEDPKCHLLECDAST